MPPKKKNPSKRYNGGSIKRTASGHIARFTLNGKRHEKHLPTEAQAQNWIDSMTITRARGGRGLNPEETSDAITARNLLQEGHTLTDCVKHYNRHHFADPGEKISLQDAVELWIAHKEKLRRRQSTLDSARVKANHLKKHLGKDTPVHTITPARILQVWTNLPGAGTTLNNYRRDWRDLFSFLQRLGKIDRNPTDAISRAYAPPPAAVAILSPKQFRALLTTARDHYPQLLHYYLLQGFLGVRPFEAMRLNSADFHDNTIHITAKTTRHNATRLLPLTLQFKTWITRYPVKDPVTPKISTIDGAHRRAYRAAGLDHWVQDTLRHSFASYHHALHGDTNALCTLLGHTNPYTFHRHYRAAVPPKDAAEWFKILP